MSPKELLYIDDALGHENCLHTLCTAQTDALQDASLRQLTQQLASGHQQRFSRLLSLLN